MHKSESGRQRQRRKGGVAERKSVGGTAVCRVHARPVDSALLEGMNEAETQRQGEI